jgi:hypothetical protein
MIAKKLSLHLSPMGVVLLLLVGCGSSKSPDVSEPRSTLRTALSAIQDDRLADFRATLSPELAKKIGDEPSLLKLRSNLAAQQEVSLGDELKVNEIIDPYSGDERKVVRQEFSEQILGRGISKTFNLLYMATVHCEFHTQESMRMRQSGTAIPANQQQEVQICQITQLE